MSQRPAFALVLTLLAITPALARAQPPVSIDQLLQQTAGEEEPTRSAPAPATSTAGAVCRTMTDLAQRSRRERVCMTPDRWEALAAAARRPPTSGRAGSSLRVAATR